MSNVAPTNTVPETDRPDTAIPIIDVSPFLHGNRSEREAVARAVGRTYERIGFLVVTGHGVPQSAIDEMYDVTAEYFRLPLEEKMAQVSPVGERHEGFAPNANPSDEGTLDARPVVREIYHSYPYDSPDEAIAAGYPEDVRTSLCSNIWPRKPERFEAIWKRYFSLMEDLSHRMLQLFAVALGMPEDFFEPMVDRDLSSMGANCYLEQPVAVPPGQLRAQAHVDFSTLTILYQDDAPGGLQAHQRDVGWVDVPYVPGSYVINLGDLMARWTNDRWVATPHRVVNPPAEHAMTRRISLPFFHLPNHDALIEPIPTCVSDAEPVRFEPVLAGEWTRARRAYASPNTGRIAV